MTDPFIQIRDLKRYYILGDNEVKALDGVNLDVAEGEFLCLMGPSGSGKSTLLNLMGGLDTPSDGVIIMAGDDISAYDQNRLAAYRREVVGFIFQSFNLIGTMTALQNIEFPMIFSGISASERKTRAAAILGQVGLEDRLDHKPTELSGGQQQRVAIARSLVNRPAILLCDEPTGNLDSKTGTEILDMLKALNDDGQTIIAVTHDPRVTEYGTRTIHMLDGRIIDDSANPATHSGQGA